MIARHSIAVLLLAAIVAEATLDGEGTGFQKRDVPAKRDLPPALDQLDGKGISVDNIPGRKRAAARPHDGIEGEGMGPFETSGGGKKRAVYEYGRGARY